MTVATGSDIDVKPARQGRRWLLYASLALNLLLIGMMFGAFFRHGGPRQMIAAQSGFNIIGYVADLPRSRREELRRSLSASPRDLKGVRQQVRVAREGILSALTAEPFDKAQFVAAQDRLTAAENAQRVAVRALTLEIVERLSPEERRAYVAWRAKQERHGRGRSEPRDLDDDPKKP
jgi:uncharacterized membrane protein